MLDKAIQHGKEHRQPYRHSKRFDKSCRNHGGCGWCLGNRLHSNRKREEEARCRLIESDLLYNMEKQIIQNRQDRPELSDNSHKKDEHTHPSFDQQEFDDEGYWNLSD